MPIDGPLAAARQTLRVARLGARELVGAARADHARLRAREQLVAADVRIVAAPPCRLARGEARLLEHAVVGARLSALTDLGVVCADRDHAAAFVAGRNAGGFGIGHVPMVDAVVARHTA